MVKGVHTRKPQADERRRLKRQFQGLEREELCGILSGLVGSYSARARIAVAAYAGNQQPSEFAAKGTLFEALTLLQVEVIIDRAAQGDRRSEETLEGWW